MKIRHGRSRSWERAAERGEYALRRRIWQEVGRIRKRRLDKKSRQINHSIPRARRRALLERTRLINLKIARDRALRKACLA